MTRNGRLVEDVTPSASRLTTSLRDIGYDFVSAVADLVDNSVSAGARRVDVIVRFDGVRSGVIIADDGTGMTRAALHEALRFGSRRTYVERDLGRFGLGLKTASLSQCRLLTVVSRTAPERRRLVARSLDLDHVTATDRWEITEPSTPSAERSAREWLDQSPGTVVIWERLDRVLSERRPEGGWARRRIEQLGHRTAEYLGMVFHRFLEGTALREEPLAITVNGEKVDPWNPFAPGEPDRRELAQTVFEIANEGGSGIVTLRPVALPPRSRFSSLEEFERLAGPQKWNRQQGLYVYRADRLVQGGGWCGVRGIDEHMKLARAAIDFDTSLDPLFQINVAKMRVSLPAEVRALIERPIQELCHAAEAVYRGGEDRTGHRRPFETDPTPATRSMTALNDAALAIEAAAAESDDLDALDRITSIIRRRAPEIASALGW